MQIRQSFNWTGNAFRLKSSTSNLFRKQFIGVVQISTFSSVRFVERIKLVSLKGVVMYIHQLGSVFVSGSARGGSGGVQVRRHEYHRFPVNGSGRGASTEDRQGLELCPERSEKQKSGPHKPRKLDGVTVSHVVWGNSRTNRLCWFIELKACLGVNRFRLKSSPFHIIVYFVYVWSQELGIDYQVAWRTKRTIISRVESLSKIRTNIISMRDRWCL